MADLKIYDPTKTLHWDYGKKIKNSQPLKDFYAGLESSFSFKKQPSPPASSIWKEVAKIRLEKNSKTYKNIKNFLKKSSDFLNTSYSSINSVYSTAKTFLNNLRNILNLAASFGIKTYKEGKNLTETIFIAIGRAFSYVKQVINKFIEVLEAGNIHFLNLFEIGFPLKTKATDDTERREFLSWSGFISEIYFQTFEDLGDPNRPNFSPDTNVGGLLFLVATPDYSIFYETYKRIKSFFKLDTFLDPETLDFFKNNVFRTNYNAKRLRIKSLEKVKIFHPDIKNEPINPNENDVPIFSFTIDAIVNKTNISLLNENLKNNYIQINKNDLTIKGLNEFEVANFSLPEPSSHLKITFNFFQINEEIRKQMEKQKIFFDKSLILYIYCLMEDDSKRMITYNITPQLLKKIFEKENKSKIYYMGADGVLYDDSTYLIPASFSLLPSIQKYEEEKQFKIPPDYSPIKPDYHSISLLDKIGWLNDIYDFLKKFDIVFTDYTESFFDELFAILNALENELNRLKQATDELKSIMEQILNFENFLKLPDVYLAYATGKGTDEMFYNLFNSKNRPNFEQQDNFYGGMLLVGQKDVMDAVALLFGIRQL
jgi:hypothetical protein